MVETDLQVDVVTATAERTSGHVLPNIKVERQRKRVGDSTTKRAPTHLWAVRHYERSSTWSTEW